MRVLVIGSDRHAEERAVATLRKAGHDVARCRDTDEPPFPCKALTTGCPLDDGDPIDVALVVREHPWPRPTSHEPGVSCAIRSGIPLVVSGKTMLNPYEPWAAEVVHGDHDLLGAIGRAVERTWAERATAAAVAFDDALRNAGVEAGEATAAAVPAGRSVRIRIRPGPGVDGQAGARAAVRALQAVRARDPALAGIDLDLEFDAGAGAPDDAGTEGHD